VAPQARIRLAPNALRNAPQAATHQTALALGCYAVGLSGYAALKVLAPAFYALNDSRTPMLVSRTLSEIIGAEVWLKFENLQFTAAYKERGALNKLLQLSREDRERGVIAASAGNHVVLTVSGLPSSENPLGIWYVDAGLGDALHEALPLVAGVYEQAPFRLVLEEADGIDNWHLVHDPAGGFVPT